MEYMEQQMQNQIESGMSEAARCYERIAELEAQVEILQKHIERVALCYYNNTGHEPSLSVFHRALDEAENAVFKEPSSCLAEIRAEAGRTGYLQALEDIDSEDDDKWTATSNEEAANQYAEKIRQGGAK